MARKVGEVFEDDGHFFITMEKKGPLGPHINVQVYLASDKGDSSLSKFWVPGSEIFKVAEKLDDFIRKLGGFSQGNSETFLIDPPE